MNKKIKINSYEKASMSLQYQTESAYKISAYKNIKNHYTYIISRFKSLWSFLRATTTETCYY